MCLLSIRDASVLVAHSLSVQCFPFTLLGSGGNHKMAQRDGLYTILSEKIARLNGELIRFTQEAESVQNVLEKASAVSTLYADM